MNREDLVRLVAAEVERRLAGEAAPPRTLALVEPGPNLRQALSLLLAEQGVTGVLVSRAARAPEAEAFPPVMEMLPDDPDRLEQEVLPGVERLLLPCLRPASAARIALGLDSGTVPRLTAAALFAGKRVTVVPGWSGTGGSPAYRALYDGYLERLRSFGVEVLAGGAGPAPAPESPQAPGETYGGRLLTEADVLALAGRGVTRLALAPRTLVTALALDAARTRGLQLERR
ncbi:MAG: hypothetical protein ACOY94_19845 [Bacillota bacterium]